MNDIERDQVTIYVASNDFQKKSLTGYEPNWSPLRYPSPISKNLQSAKDTIDALKKTDPHSSRKIYKVVRVSDQVVLLDESC